MQLGHNLESILEDLRRCRSFECLFQALLSHVQLAQRDQSDRLFYGLFRVFYG